VVALVEHIGDIVASEPIDRFLKDRAPHETFIFRIVKSRYKEVIQFNPNIDKIIEVGSLSEWIYLRFFLRHFSKVEIVDLHVDKRTCFRHYLTISNPNEKGIDVFNYFHFGNLLEVFSLTAGLPKLDTKPIYHFPARPFLIDLPEKYVVVHTLSNGESKMWPTEKWSKLAEHLIKEGYHVIELGLHPQVRSDSKMFINRCGKLSFTEIAYVIKRCALFIGIDSSFAHFANALDVKNVLILLGDLHDFKNYVPYSGLSPEQIKEIIIRQEGPLRDLEVNAVIERTTGKLVKG
jgi:ADP-heptose:LPS heptosyltransferase